MTDQASENLRDSLTEVALAAIYDDQVDIATAATTLLSAAAILIAMLPESEWYDFLGQAWDAMPKAVQVHAAHLEAAGIEASRAPLQ